MTDLPPGEWSGLLVGHQWPTSASVAPLRSVAQERYAYGRAFAAYANGLSAVRVDQLANQEGMTAESNRALFLRGEHQSRDVADKSLAKRDAYEAARQSVESLRGSLADLAAEGNAAIEEVRRSPQPTSVKTSRIVAIITRVSTEADGKAALCAADVYSSIQSVLDTEGLGISARAFAKSQGFEKATFGAPANLEVLTGRVSAALEKLNPPTGGEQNVTASEGTNTDPLLHETVSQSVAQPGQSDGGRSGINSTNSGFPLGDEGRTTDRGPQYQPAPSARAAPVAAEKGSLTAMGTQNPAARFAGSQPSGDDSAPNDVGRASGISSTSGRPSGQIRDAERLPDTATGGSQAIPNSAHRQVFTMQPADESIEGTAEGLNTAAPASAATDATASTATTSAQSIPATALNPHFVDQTNPAPSPAESAHAVPPVTGTPHLAVGEAPRTVITPATAPTTPNTAPAFTTTPPTVPPGPLLGYGADLKSSMPTTQAVSPPGPATPVSAPVTPASGTSGNGQPALVRQQSPTPATRPSASAAALAERAFAATSAAGTAAVAAADRAAAESRLQHLLDAVARQQPQLRWAIGDREDGTVVLATDLAQGWIPPSIDIPVGVRLPPPGVHRKDLISLLGPVTLGVMYEPGRCLPTVTQPTPMSILARDTKQVDDLGWELSQATKWRDGLPRLAHTLARAASARTGMLDSEIALLREHLTSIERAVLGRYPQHVDADEVGNWQLLATIEALIENETTSAHYHFAWFRAREPRGSLR